MKNFVGIDFEDIDVTELNMDELLYIRNALMERYSYTSEFPHGRSNQDKIIKHMGNYVKLDITPVLNWDQYVAVALGNLPENISKHSECNKNTIISYFIKEVLKHDCSKVTTYEERMNFVQKYRSTLDINNDWQYSAKEIYRAVCAENLAQANNFLKELSLLDQELPKEADAKYRQFIVCSQIVNYIDILSKLWGEDDVISLKIFRSGLEQKTFAAIKKIIELENKKIVPTKCGILREMFFVYNRCYKSADSSNNRVAPESKAMAKKAKQYIA